ncbi:MULTISPECIES: hypothetical protein [Leptolyngbya]|jgi:hypothetical protein|uniref:Uncharacterized protein n=2 Tax=Leptolyngbya boryana TaxID=1184 RepID=A0A1Z4JFM3_LEPBY|nr:MULTISPECIES: hypothetical protein [Leptolyngbya]BAY55559.1 hypothetical protein NIES2135_23830 [Leptolyngbya boryana NIES-2135]MBD1854274.1 hypothetical protein [Leptolyngbya sp. FACHB-1624]MBD2371463.1 hypothetical protein [Leptolyngbya sp. FACHB-161]MBD2377974.1 hypothetical protein [Leptolyngbya sp. FACHB-238]MBD2402409.1 hypothetical protein [Leptolyngbya sp. FACHB-239]
MFILELTLKGTPIGLSFHRKSAEDAEATYQEIIGAMKAPGELLEFTCDRQTDKKIAVFADSIAAVQMYEKSSAAASGRPAGFFAVAAE